MRSFLRGLIAGAIVVAGFLLALSPLLLAVNFGWNYLWLYTIVFPVVMGFGYVLYEK